MLLKIISDLWISFLLKQQQLNQKKENSMYCGVGTPNNKTTLVYETIFTPFSIFMPI